MAALGAMHGSLVVQGRVRVPGDKSVSHRTLMLAALATGTSTIRGILESEDVHSTAEVLRALGWPIPEIASDMRVEGRGLQSPETAALRALQCGNSGTTTRLTAGIAAAQPFASTFLGDASLSRRPMRRVTDPLEAMGARVEWLGTPDRLPMQVHGGALTSLSWELDVASAQLKSAILLAGLCGGVAVRVREPAPTRDHTEQMLRSLGVQVTTANDWITLAPVASLPPATWDVPGDPSSAAYFLGLAALADQGELVLENVLASPFRDGFVRVLKRMGADVALLPTSSGSAGATNGIVVRAGAALHPVTVAADEVPAMIDELPLLAVLAARIHGETTVRGAAELRVKESDRIAVTVANLRAIGADADELPDGFVVRGNDAPLRGVVETHGDHRIAMAFGVLSATRGVDIRIDHREIVAVSYPGFWNDLERVTRARLA
jgi:3-phosphoshikimate 1-carboxyvinyltransferase